MLVNHVHLNFTLLACEFSKGRYPLLCIVMLKGIVIIKNQCKRTCWYCSCIWNPPLQPLHQFQQSQLLTLFSKRSAHWFTPVLPVTLGHWPWPRVMSIFSNGLDSNMQKTPFKNSIRFWHWVFCELLSRPIDKIKMTLVWGRWPRDLRKWWFSCALLSEKSVSYCRHSFIYIEFGVVHECQKPVMVVLTL